MTTKGQLELLQCIARDTATLRADTERWQRLVDAVHAAIPMTDAVALLRLVGEDLVPLAAYGLQPQVLGQRWRRGEQPRLQAICDSEGPVRFAADSQLADPYDGFVDGVALLGQRVHSCLGVPLRIEGQLVGALTLDALPPRAFESLDDEFLAAVGASTAAALRTGDLLVALERQAQLRGQIARDLVRDALVQQGGLLVGNSPAMVQLRREIDRIAVAEFPVLVTGETGTGKELVVRMLHASSRRREQPLVQVNCSALPESIAESELFGHQKGAFTGAVATRLGKFQAADGASLFLDEVGELPLSLQPKLLRALQTGEVQSLGSDAPRCADVRVFAATNRDLQAEVRAGRFRSDLLYRLDVCRLRLPPLRERREDVLPLAGHACDRIRRQLGTGRVQIAADAQAALLGYDWPGNVRELENVLARAVLRASPRHGAGRPVTVTAEDLALVAPDAGPAGALATGVLAAADAAATPFRERVRSFERALVQRELSASAGNWARAAGRLGMHRSNLHHLARRLGLR